MIILCTRLHLSGLSRMSISIKDISQLSGVSTATVSRVINNLGTVSPKTQAHVKEVIARYGYVPNMVAKGLRTNLMSSVGIIVPEIVNEPYGLLVRTAQQQLLKLGIISTICNTNDNPETAMQYINILKSQYASGVIYIPDSRYGSVRLWDLPVVYIENRPSHTIAANSAIVVSDDRRGGYIATKELLEKGCRNIIIYMDLLGRYSFTNRYLGYCDALKEYGLKPSVENTIYVEPLHSTDVIQKTQELIRQGHAFDGAFCTANRITTGAMSALASAGRIHTDGLRENDVKLVGYEDIRLSNYGLFPVTTVAIETEEMAITAVDLMVAMLEGKPPVKQEVVFPVHLIHRNTT